MKPEVEQMLKIPGFYVAIDPKTAHNTLVPMVAVDGRVYSMARHEELDPVGYLDQVIIHRLIDFDHFRRITDAMYNALKAALPDYKAGAIMGDTKCLETANQIMEAMNNYKKHL